MSKRSKNVDRLAGATVGFITWLIDSIATPEYAANVRLAIERVEDRFGSDRALPLAGASLAGVLRSGVRVSAAVVLVAVALALSCITTTAVGKPYDWIIPVDGVLLALAATCIYGGAASAIAAYPIGRSGTLLRAAFYVGICALACMYLARVPFEATLAWLDHLERAGGVTFTDRGYAEVQRFLSGLVALFIQVPLMAFALGALVRRRRQPPLRFAYSATLFGFVVANLSALLFRPVALDLSSAFGDVGQFEAIIPLEGIAMSSRQALVEVVQLAGVIVLSMFQALLGMFVMWGAARYLAWQERRLFRVASEIAER